jgi:hypothetical protein
LREGSGEGEPGGLEAVRQAGFHVGAHRDAVHHHLDVVLVLLVERGGVLDGVEFAVDAHAGKAGLLPFRQLAAILALAAAHHRGEEIGAGALRQGHHPVDHLAHRLRRDGQARGGRIGDADPRPEEAHIIVDLGDGGDGGARVAAGRLLLDRDGGREAVNMLDIRLLHHLQELARISGERLHIAALALGIDGVEGKARLARAGQAGDDDQLVPRQIDVDPLEVMLARAAHTQMCQTHAACSIFVLEDVPEGKIGAARAIR